MDSVFFFHNHSEVIDMNYAYVRVSTKEQCEDRQIDALNDFRIDRIFIDKASGKNFDRPQYQALLQTLRHGDLLVLHSIDRLGRNFEEILEQWKILTKEIGVQIYVITMPLLDTRKENGLMGTLITDLVLQLLSFAQETERNAIRERQREGILAARARGKALGRPKKKIPDNYEEIVEQWRSGRITQSEMLEQLSISKTTFYRMQNARK